MDPQIFDEALRHPSPGFALGKRLAEAHPELAMVEGQSPLDIERFATDGHCTIEPRGDLYNQYSTGWFAEQGIYTRARCEWARVTWRQATLDVVWLTWGNERDTLRYYILAEERECCTGFIEAVYRWSYEVRGEVLAYSNGCFRKDAKLFKAVESASFDQLVLHGSFKDQIRDDFKQFMTARATYDEHDVPWRRGALFIGPPGNGKTLCVKALVRELAIPCIYVQSFEQPRTPVQRGIEEVFKRARAQAPCILVLEDIDALLVPGSHSFFLNELDGFAANMGIITLATTNHPERLDPSIVERPSRFDRKYHFDLPDGETRVRYATAWNARLRPTLQLSADGIARIAELTAGFSFAYIQEVFVSSMMHWVAMQAAGGILAVAVEQVELLRGQMQSQRPA